MCTSKKTPNPAAKKTNSILSGKRNTSPAVCKASATASNVVFHPRCSGRRAHKAATIREGTSRGLRMIFTVAMWKIRDMTSARESARNTIPATQAYIFINSFYLRFRRLAASRSCSIAFSSRARGVPTLRRMWQ